MALIKPGSPGDTSASRIAEQRIREWTLNLESQRRHYEKSSTVRLSEQIHPYIAISREAGAGGAAVALRIGELLHWDVLNRELLDQMAEKSNLPREMLGLVDEKTSNWIVEIFGKWLDPRLVTQSEYLVHLGQIVLLAAQHASIVFVGRGAQFYLPAERGLSVYLVAPLAQRVARIKELHRCSHTEAQRYVRETDRGRRDLIRSAFNHEVGDPHLYDLVVNLAHTSIDSAAELICDQCRRRFPER